MVARERARCFFSVRLSSLRSSLLLERFSACMCVCICCSGVFLLEVEVSKVSERKRAKHVCCVLFNIQIFRSGERGEEDFSGGLAARRVLRVWIL